MSIADPFQLDAITIPALALGPAAETSSAPAAQLSPQRGRRNKLSEATVIPSEYTTIVKSCRAALFSRQATTWLRNRFTEFGWSCSFDEWTIINYSKPMSLRNVVCKLPSPAQREIVVVAHHDQAPTTIEGADNDGSGIAVLLLYLFVTVGLLETYALYPATSKDPALLHPRWPTVILFIVGLALLLGLGRWLVRCFSGPLAAPTPAERKSLALLMIGLAGIYVLLINPFSLVFFVPLLFWFLR